jgi:hypothetical protein
MKKIIDTKKQKNSRIKFSAKPAISIEYKEELRLMSNKELVAHRRQLIKDRDVNSSEYWNRMWSVNAEMASRFITMTKEESR